MNNWSFLCEVDIAPLAAWLAEGDKAWPAPSTPCKPQRVREIPPGLFEPIAVEVIGKMVAYEIAKNLDSSFTVPVAADPMLSRMLPGQSHGFHVDRQRADWITRVHVPITTNPGCWMAWEEDHSNECYVTRPTDEVSLPDYSTMQKVAPSKVHFEAGRAYSFNTLERHAFGNDGETERVHLIFDVLRKDA